MPINFFEAKCSETTNAALFGLCDDPPPDKNPAYVDYDGVNKAGWIAEVDNKGGIDVTFTAIDNCIEILRADGTEESRCEGYLTYPDTIIFVELKDRESRGWVAKGRDQLLKTIELFESNHGADLYVHRRAHIANRQRPAFMVSYQQVINDFKIANGFTLGIQSKIEIL